MRNAGRAISPTRTAVACALGLLAGCGGPSLPPPKPVDASVAAVQPRPLGETEGVWKGLWKYEGNTLTHSVIFDIGTHNGDFVGSLRIARMPNRSTYQMSNFTADGTKIRFDYKLFGTSNSGTPSLGEALGKLAKEQATPRPVRQGLLVLTAPGAADVYDLNLDTGQWEQSEGFKVRRD